MSIVYPVKGMLNWILSGQLGKCPWLFSGPGQDKISLQFPLVEHIKYHINPLIIFHFRIRVEYKKLKYSNKSTYFCLSAATFLYCSCKLSDQTLTLRGIMFSFELATCLLPVSNSASHFSVLKLVSQSEGKMSSSFKVVVATSMII